MDESRPGMSPTEQEIAALEKEIYEKQQKLNALRRQAPATPVGNPTLKGRGGSDVRLGDLFGSRSDLIVIHNMGSRCAYCTLWADGFNGMVPHFENRAALAVVSPDPPETQEDFANRRGWRFRMLSDTDASFATEMGFAEMRDGKRHFLPGFSTFRRQDDGTIRRVAHAAFGPGDPYCGIWHMFDLLDGGAGDWSPKFTY
jgi:predicted dithiol-disulfide oxidoreductase (DUF899 family)